jgi:predicted nucleotide-binding protein (sugar kinase/HSP70/actin superfamily)
MHSLLHTFRSTQNFQSVCMSLTLCHSHQFTLQKKSCVQLFVILVLATKKGYQNVLQGTSYVP